MTISAREEGGIRRPPAVLWGLAVTAIALPAGLASVSVVPGVPPAVGVVAGLAAAGAAVALFALLVRAARRRPDGGAVVRATRIVAFALAVGVTAAAVVATSTRISVVDLGGDLLTHLTLLVVLLLIAVPARTVRWWQLAAVLLCGFLAVPAAARIVGVPVVQALGVGDPVATSLWVPLTEELLKVLPPAVIALLACRGRLLRPAAVDIALLGAASGAGFALAEDAAYGGVFSRGAAPFPVSVLLPTVRLAGRGDVFQAFAGHAVWTALLGLGVGYAMLYGRRHRFAWVAAPAAFAVVLAEHAVYNLGGPSPVLLLPIVGGLLSSILLLAGFLTLSVLERRRLLDVEAVLSGLGIASPVVQMAALGIRQRRTES